MLLFSINLTQTKDLLGFFWGIGLLPLFYVHPIAIVQDASKISKRLKHDPSGVIIQRGKWLIDR